MMSKLANILTKLKGHTAVINTLPLVITCSVIAALYMLGVIVKPGLLTWAASVPPLGLIAVTALARVNDIKKGRTGALWQARRVGLSLTGTAACVLLCAPLVDTSSSPTWKGLMMYYGFALTWLTTPNMPPWWKYISQGQEMVRAGD